MPRLRTLKPSFFTNDLLAEVPPLGRLLFAGLWCQADREGRLEDRPRRLKAEVLPYDDCDVDALLNDLAARGFIVRYAVADSRYIAIPKFEAHQSPHIKEPASTIPAPSDHGTHLPISSAQHQTSTVLAPDKHRASNPPCRAVVGSGEWGVGSGLGSGHPTTASQSPGVAPDADAPDAPQSPTAGLGEQSEEPPARAPGTELDEAPAPVTTPAPLVADPSDAPAAMTWLGPLHAPIEAPKPRGHPFGELWDAFDGVFGEARTRTEQSRRGRACKEAREAHATGEELLLAAQHWPNVMGDATMTELGIVANLGKLLHGPQVNGRNNGTVSHRAADKRGRLSRAMDGIDEGIDAIYRSGAPSHDDSARHELSRQLPG